MIPKGQVLVLPRREKTQYRSGWPFLYSVVPGRRGLVRNVPPPPEDISAVPPRRRDFAG